MVITIFLCTPLRIRYLQPKILCSGKGEGFLEGRVFPITTPGYVAPPSERVVLFSLAVVFGEIRPICQCIPNSKFFQVDLF